MHCKWKACPHVPHTTGESSPGNFSPGAHAFGEGRGTHWLSENARKCRQGRAMTLQRRSRHVRAPQTRAGRCRTRRRLRSSSTRPPRAIASRAQKSLPSERAMTPRASDIRHSRAPRKQLVRRVSLNARQLSHRWARPKPATLAPLCARCTLAPTLAGSHARLTFSCGAAPSPPGPPALLPLAIAAPAPARL